MEGNVAWPPGSCLRVYGAGTGKVNGFYKNNGEYRKKPQYILVDANGEVKKVDGNNVEICACPFFLFLFEGSLIHIFVSNDLSTYVVCVSGLNASICSSRQ